MHIDSSWHTHDPLHYALQITYATLCRQKTAYVL